MKTMLAIALLLVAGGLSGCGYSSGPLLARAPGGEAVRSIYVPILSNDSHRRQVEEPLTDALIKEIQSTTNLRIMKKGQDADSKLVLRLLDLQEVTSVENRFNVITQGDVRFTIGVEWIDLRTGKPIPLQSDTIRESRDFTVTRGETFATAAAEVAEKIAEKIVEAMYRDMD